jgi:hypothetical protein
MATCPRCKGHLTENHRCPRSASRRTFEMIFAAIAGVFGALLLVSVVDPHGQMSMDAVFLIIGAFVGVGLDYWIRG